MTYHRDYSEQPPEPAYDPTEIARLEALHTELGEGWYASPRALDNLYSQSSDHEPAGTQDVDYRELMHQGGLPEASEAGGNLTADDPLIRFVRERGPEWGEPTSDNPLGAILGIHFPREGE